MTVERHEIDDRMQTALAMTHHIQTRIVQCIARGEVSGNIADDVSAKCQVIAEAFCRARG